MVEGGEVEGRCERGNGVVGRLDILCACTYRIGTNEKYVCVCPLKSFKTVSACHLNSRKCVSHVIDKKSVRKGHSIRVFVCSSCPI